MTDQEVRRREIFFLWLSVLSVIIGYALTTTASSDQPNDIWFISGVMSAFLGSILAFGFVLYISFCSDYNFQKTVSDKNEHVSGENQENAKSDDVPKKFLENETMPGKYQEEIRDITENQEIGMGEKAPDCHLTPTSPNKSSADEEVNCSDSYQTVTKSGKRDLELVMLQQAEYAEVQDIISKATRVLQEFSLIAEKVDAQRRKRSCSTSFHSCDTSFH